MLTFDDLAREVEQSGLFDADWYVKTFPDARLVDARKLTREIYRRSGSLYGAWLSHLLLDCGIMWIGYDLIDWSGARG